MTLSQAAQERVSKGAALLDERKPGALKSINPNELNLNSFRFCVLGFIYGTSAQGRAELGLTAQDMLDHGFSDELPGGVTGEAWRVLIAERRGCTYPR